MAPTTLSPPTATAMAMSSPHTSMLDKARPLNATLFMTKKLLFVLLLFALDIRDIVYKVAWIGPTDSYSFLAGSVGILHAAPLVSTVTSELRALDAGEHVVSGWSSFLSQCDELRAFGAGGGTFFLSALATNCNVRVSHNTTRVIPQLVLTSSFRVDALIWASCLFLHIARRPPMCQDHVTTHFNDRYALFVTKVRNVDVATPESDAEREILDFLELMSTSIPLHRIVCVEAFEIALNATGHGDGNGGTFNATLYGCASPNLFRSAFVGVAAPQYARVLDGKAWLTSDELSLLGQRFGIRQNAQYAYTVVPHTVVNADGTNRTTLSLTSRSRTNFSAYGPLYALMVTIDVWLLVTHCYSVLEILKWMHFPQYRELQTWIRTFESAHDSSHSSNNNVVAPERLVHPRSATVKKVYTSGSTSPSARVKQHVDPTDALDFHEERFYAFFSASYYKTPTYVWLTRLTRTISWVIILPNSVVWTWSASRFEQAQAFLSSVKSWVLIASAFQLLWRAVVRVSEARAYAFARGTFVTNPEIIAIGALAAIVLRDDIFLMCEAKWHIEHQRVNDATSFAGGYVAHGNTFDRENDYQTSTPLEVLVIVFGPLVNIILLSLVLIVAWLVVKYVYFAVLHARGSNSRQQQRSSTIAAGASDEPGTNCEHGALAAAASPRDVAACSAKHRDLSSHETSEPLDVLPYARLPLEDALDVPIRANSIVRYGLNMEIVRNGKRYIRPSCYLDYGIMLKHGAMKAHVGVADIFQHAHSRHNLHGNNASEASSSSPAGTTPRRAVPIDRLSNELLSRNNSTALTPRMLVEAASVAAQDALLAAASARSNDASASSAVHERSEARDTNMRSPRGPTMPRGSTKLSPISLQESPLYSSSSSSAHDNVEEAGAKA